MNIVLIVFAAAGILELTTYLSSVMWRFRKVVVWPIVVICMFTAGAVVVSRLNIWSLLFVVAACYRLINLLRVAEGRMHAAYLLRATRRSGLAILGVQLLALVLWSVLTDVNRLGHWIWIVATAAQLLAALTIFVSTVRRIRKTRWLKQQINTYADKDLPSITVAIPARNETDDLQECLLSLIASDYPKMEIIVLDDCSQLRKTPEIIRSFAHAGVRFVQGGEAPSFWLAKNFAYQRLLDESVGEFVVFCGVDVRFSSGSLRKIVIAMKEKNKSMMSILPLRSAAVRATLSPIQTMRYWWELALPRRLFRRPAVISSFWCAKRSFLQSSGSFAAVARSIVPEAYFAKRATQNDGYSFMRANEFLGIESTKSAIEQRDTAVRMRYPQLHRRPESVMFLSFLQISFFVLPFVFGVAGFWFDIGWHARGCSSLAAILLTATYCMVARKTRAAGVLQALILPFFAFVLDLAVLHLSMWRYEFSVVDWRGRNICVPAMHVFPHIPQE